jgi:hypothetical protein
VRTAPEAPTSISGCATCRRATRWSSVDLHDPTVVDRDAAGIPGDPVPSTTVPLLTIRSIRVISLDQR